MGLFDLFRKKKEYNVSLYAVSRRLKIAEATIVSILIEAGFDIFYSPYVMLNERHLEILSQKYVEAIKSYHANSIKNYHNLNIIEQAEIKRFFAKFIQHDNFWDSYLPNYEDKVFESKLDTDLIKSFFYQIIDEIQFVTLYGDYDSSLVDMSVVKQFNKFLYKIKLKTKSTFNNTKSKLFSIIITSHYYIFSDDEDHTAKAKFVQCFSAVRNLLREALNYINHLKFHKKWKEFSYS